MCPTLLRFSSLAIKLTLPLNGNLPPGFLKIFSSTVWLLLEQIIRLGLTLAIGLIFTRYLGPHRYGVYSYAFSLVGLIGIAAKLGLDALVVRDLVERPTQANRIVGTAFGLKLLGGVVIFVGSAWISYGLGDDSQTSSIVLLMALSFIFQAFEVINFWYQSRVIARPMATARTVALITISLIRLALILVGAPLHIFAWLVTGEVVLTAACMLFLYQTDGQSVLQWRFDKNLAGRLLLESWPLVISAAMASVYMKIDQIMLEKLATPEAVGIYAAAVRFSEVWYFIPLAIITSIFPSVLQAKQIAEELYRKRMQQVYDLLVWISLIVSIVVSFLSPFIVDILLGKEYHASSPILALHIWSGIFIFLETARMRWLIAEKLTKFQFFTTVLGALSNVILNLWLIPLYSGFGAAIATLVSYAIAIYLSCFLYPQLWPAARQMSLALIVPLRIRDNLSYVRQFILVFQER